MLAPRYIADFRKSAEAEEILKTIQRPHVQISKTAGEKWRAMDDDAKAVSSLVFQCGASG